MRLRSALLVATVLAAPIAAMAQPITGPYIAGGGGVNYREDQDFGQILGKAGPYRGFNLGNGGNGDSNSGLKLKSQIGWVALGSVGYGFGNGFRVEIEGDYRQNEVRKITGTPFPAVAGGTVEEYGAMVNALYDFDLAPYTGIDFVYPYLGVGVGYGGTHFESGKYTATTLSTLRASSTDTDGNLAYQGIAGLSFPISSVPGLSVTAEYRFYGQIGDETFRGAADTGGTQTLGGRTYGTFKLKDQYNDSGLIGLRYAFNVPSPPPPAPAPVPVVPVAPTRSYLVFFDWDKATLTDRARQIIHEAADNSTHVQHTTIEVNGYTDTSGTPKYNQGLSVRRADAVAGELVRDGVARSEISIHGYGETHLLVATGPGVREPQNRRVEIIIH